MPIPGPRTQFGPVEGHRNPENAAPTLFNLWKRPDPIHWSGRTPGMMTVTLRGCTLGAGQIRRLWRQTTNYVGAQAPYSWTEDRPRAGDPADLPARGFEITRALRYMTRSVYLGGGLDNSRYAELHSVVRKQHHYKEITIGRGQTRSRPTIRNRLSSFGSRVPTLNQEVEAANTTPGAGGGGN